MLTLAGKVGQRVELIYPVRNILGCPLEYLERKVEIASVRSIADEPLSLQSFLMRPFLRRGVHLIDGREDGERKRFYFECCKDEREPGLQFVVVDDDEPMGWIEPISRVFAPNLRERRIMLEMVAGMEAPAGFTVKVRAVE
jgi:hypothetical protein